ncbi:MAG: MBL fold metallo-hydrolase [Halobacteriales archaeon]|nr:MBL fold metallo-hydrolase [Halobacteriales archaeon]
MAERLAPGIWLLDLGWPAPLGTNAYLVADGDGELTMVDAGMPINATSVRSEIQDTGFAVDEIDRVLITHYDLDHVGGLARLVPALDAPVYIGETDRQLYDGGYDPPWLHHKGLFHRGLRALHRLPADLEIRGVADGDRIGDFLAFHTPGHNPGHTVYINEAQSVGLLGDLVWEEDGEFTTPIWFDSYDLSTIRRSIRRLVAESPPFEVACVGHGTPLRANGLTALKALANDFYD